MDPFSALGTAAAIAQVVDSSIVLIEGVRQIFELSVGYTTENKQLWDVMILGLLEKVVTDDHWNSAHQSAIAASRSAWSEKEKEELAEIYTQLTVLLGFVDPSVTNLLIVTLHLNLFTVKG
jgi:hypothetical protein